MFDTVVVLTAYDKLLIVEVPCVGASAACYFRRHVAASA